MRRPLARHLLLAVALLTVIGGPLYSSYTARRAIVHAQRLGCERGKLDRAANARGWRVAESARLRTAKDPAVGRAERASALEAAHLYAGIVAGLEVRARIDCAQAFPEPPAVTFR